MQTSQILAQLKDAVPDWCCPVATLLIAAILVVVFYRGQPPDPKSNRQAPGFPVVPKQDQPDDRHPGSPS
jgi:hypothetical protein